MSITLPPPYNNAPIRPADVTQTMIDLYNVVAQINAGLSPIPINLSGPGGAALIGTTPAGGITSTNVQASLNELDTKKTTASVLASTGGAALVGNTPAGGVTSTTVQAAINELDTKKTSVTTLAGAGGAGLVGNTPSGGITSVTVQGALNELDTKKASIAAVQSSSIIEAIGTGTADAILGAYTPAITSLTNGLELYVLSPGANTVIAPTFKADGTTAKTIVKDFGTALQASDYQGWLTLRYDSGLDKWVLLNPSTPPGTALLISSENSGQLGGFRNRIINGDMRIDQRNSGSAVTPGTGTTYILDRHELITGAASKLTVQQVADAPPGFKFSTKLTVASQYAAAAAEEFDYRQAIEGQNLVDLQFGTATAQTITYSFWVKGSVAGTYSAFLTNGPRSYVATFTVTNAWVKQTITLVADTTGTWNTDNTAGLFIGIDLGSGTNFNETAGSWQAVTGRRTAGSVAFVNQVNTSTLNITGVQLELGALSTPFEQRSISGEFLMCQRYYSEVVGGAGMCTSTTAAYIKATLPVTMRVAPAITSLTAGSLSNATGGAVAVTSNVVLNTDTFAPLLNVGVAAGLVAGNGTVLFGSRLAFNSEL